MSTELTEERLAKLPRWASNELEQRGRTIHELRTQLAAARMEAPGTGRVVLVNPLSYKDEDNTSLPDDAVVEFKIGEGVIRVWRDRQTGSGALTIMSQDGGLVIRPRVTNVVEVEVNPR